MAQIKDYDLRPGDIVLDSYYKGRIAVLLRARGDGWDVFVNNEPFHEGHGFLSTKEIDAAYRPSYEIEQALSYSAPNDKFKMGLQELKPRAAEPQPSLMTEQLVEMTARAVKAEREVKQLSERVHQAERVVDAFLDALDYMSQWVVEQKVRRRGEIYRSFSDKIKSEMP
jgi:hypothetical protein